MDISVFHESITTLFNKLCIQQLKITADKKRALVINKNFERDHIATLKKRLYRKLFVTLHSPVVLPSSKELTEDDDAVLDESDHRNVYNCIAKNIFYLRLRCCEKDAEKLETLCQEMKCFDSKSGDRALQLLQLLSNSIDKEKKSTRLKYSKDDMYANNMFQFDEKALQIDESGIDLFGSIYDVDDNRFIINNDQNKIFSFTPGAQQFGIASSKRLKESKYSERTRCSLFGGLTNSLTTSMEVALNLPELPKDSYDMEATLPFNGRDLYNQESVDEGFEELSTTTTSDVLPHSYTPVNLNIWDKAASLERKKVLSWERDGSSDPRSNGGYLTELGDKAFDCMYHVKLCEIEQITGKTLKEKTISQEQVFQDSLNVLIGVQSTTYSFQPSTFSMKPATNIRCTGISAESLHGLMTKFAMLGTNYRQLRKFCSHHVERPVTGHSGGSLLKAFIDALNEILQSYWYAVFTVADLKDLSLTELWHLFERFSRQLKLLADICLCSEAFKRRTSARPKFPVGPGLMSYLYSLSAKNTSTEHYPLLLYLFKSASLPYIKFISNWLFNGTCNDSFGEFFVFLDYQYLTYRDKFFWTQGFQMKQSKNAIPLFLDDMANDIFACGKAINLLRLTNIQHYLFDQDISPPVLTITFSSDRLDVIEKNTNRYLQRVQDREQFAEEQREKKKLEEKEVWKTKLIAEKATSEEALAKINAMENDILTAIKDNKEKELQRLKQQFEAAVEERKLKRQQKLEEDHKFLEEVKQMEDMQDGIKQKARDELIAYYQALSDEADQRERHARWIIERYELSNKRLQFLSRDQARIEGEIKRAALEQESRGQQRESVETPASPLDEVDNILYGNDITEFSATGSIVQNTVKESSRSSNDTESFKQFNAPKDILYSASSPPTNDHPNNQRRSTEQVPLNPDQNVPQAVILPGNIEGQETKDLLYPGDINELSKEERIVDQRQAKEGAETKNLLYNTSDEGDTTNVFTSKGGVQVDSGHQVKDALYPSTVYMDADNFTSKGGVQVDSGHQVKDSLYPSTVDMTTDNFTSKGGVQVDTGHQVKDALYPYTVDVATDIFTSKEGVQVDSGHQVKDALYPSTVYMDADNFTSKGGVQFDSGHQVKASLYPSTVDMDADNFTSKEGVYVDSGHQVKDSLYPSTVDVATDNFTSKGGVQVDSGHQVKDALYPSTVDVAADNFTSKGGVQVDSGHQVKDALYPSTVDVVTDNFTTKGIVQVDSGHQVKDALYPSTVNVATDNFTSKGGVQVDSGHQVKDALYPSTVDVAADNFTSKGGVQVDSGHQVKDALYPSTVDVATDNFTSKGGVQVDIGHQVKDALYPSTSDASTENVQYKGTPSGMYIEGTETKSLLYPSSKEESKRTNTTKPTQITSQIENENFNGVARETFSEGSETKSLLYPGEADGHIANGAGPSRQFEKQSTMQQLLYPDSFDHEASSHKEKVSRGFEPPTSIKAMMYPVVKDEVKGGHEVAPLRPEDVWMDLSVEPYVDDFSIIENDPHPYKSFETVKSYFMIQSEHDKNADAIKKLPLETIIKRSLTTPIQAQISLVNKAVIRYFMEELHIRDHFDAFRKFLLLEDGEFGHSLCSQLFQKISSGMRPQEFCNTIRLNNIIIEALRLSLYASRIEYSTQLTFSLKSVPEIFQPSDVGVLDFLELRYQVPWPCNIIVTENSITKYNKVFSFLIRLKRANWSLQEVWVNLKKAGHSRKAATSPQLRQLQLFRHEMQHFVNNLERYTVNQILHVSWEEFQQDLEKKVNSLDDLHRCHTVYQKKIIFRSLLSKNAAPVYKIINDIFGMISKFVARLEMVSWKVDEQSGHVTHPMFLKLQQVHNDFKQCIEFLFSVISKLVRRGYQDHLADLLLQVNFNSHYSTAVIHN